MKTFSKLDIAIIKRTAQNVAPYVSKKHKLSQELEQLHAAEEGMIQEAIEKARQKAQEKYAAKIAKVTAEKDAFQKLIDSFQGPIKDMTGGYTTEDLVTREVVHTGQTDPKTGKEKLQTRFVLVYPETVVPNIPTTSDDSTDDYNAAPEADEAPCDRNATRELEEEVAQEDIPEEAPSDFFPEDELNEPVNPSPAEMFDSPAW